jgi:hypothetical protein
MTSNGNAVQPGVAGLGVNEVAIADGAVVGAGPGAWADAGAAPIAPLAATVATSATAMAARLIAAVPRLVRMSAVSRESDRRRAVPSARYGTRLNVGGPPGEPPVTIPWAGSR